MPRLKLSPTLERIRAQRLADQEKNQKAKPAKAQAEADAPAPDQATADPAASAPAPASAAMPTDSAAPSVGDSPAASGWFAPDSPLLKPLPPSAPPELQSFFSGIPLGALGTGALLLAGAAGLGSSSKGGGPSGTGDVGAPALKAARLSEDGLQLTLSYNEAISSALPGKTSFTVSVDGVNVAVDTVARGSDASSVVLTLAKAATNAQLVRVNLAEGALIKDLAGNAAAGIRDLTPTDDKSPPALVSKSAVTGADASFVLLRYSEELKASAKPEVGDFTVKVNGSAAPLSAIDILGDTVRLTLASRIANPASATVQLSFIQPASGQALQDAAGNLAASINPAGGLSVDYSQDLTAPTLTVPTPTTLDSAGAWLLGLPSRVVRLSFNEALDLSSLPPASSLSVQLNSGGASQFIALSSLRISGGVLELTLAETVSPSQAGLRVSYTPPSSGAVLQDWAGNDVAAFDRSIATPDRVAPSLVSKRFTSSQALELTFSEALASQAPDKSQFTLTANGTTLKPTSLSVSGLTLTLNFGADIQTGKPASLNYAAPASDATPLNQALQDSAGNDLASFELALDSTAPRLTQATTSKDGLSISLTYDEALLSPSSSGTPAIPAVAATAFKVFRSQGSEVTVSNVSVFGTTVTLSLASALSASDTVSLFYVPPAASIGVANAALQDSSGNDAAALGSGVNGQVVKNDVGDVLAPLLSSARVITNAANSKVLLSYSEDLLATGTPASTAFTVLDLSNNAAVAVSGVEVLGREVFLLLAARLGTSSGVQVSYSAPGSSSGSNVPLKDLAGNVASSFSNVSASQTADSVMPSLLSAVSSADGNQIQLTFSEALDAGHVPALSSLSLTAGTAAVSISSLSIAGSTVTLSLGQRLHGLRDFLLSYTDPSSGDDRPALQDEAGNDVASFNAQAVTDLVDRNAPVYLGASLKAGNVLQLRFGEALGASLPDKAAFGVLNGSSALTVTGVQLSGGFVELSLAETLSSASGVSVSYTAPAASIATSNAALQDVYGNDVLSFSTGALDGTAPQLLSAVSSASGTQVLLTFNETLASTGAPLGAYRIVDASAADYSVSSASITGSVLTLNLASTLPSSGKVFLSYTAPDRNDSLSNSAIQDSTGNDAASIGSPTLLEVGNKVAPTLTRLGLDSQQSPLDAVVLRLSEAPSGAAPDKSAFSLSLAGVAQTIDSLSVSGNEVTLKLASALAAEGTLRLSYTPPASNALKDADANPLAAQSEVVLGQVKAGTAGADTLTGQASLNDYFLGSRGNDALSGLGGTDTFVWPDFGSSGPGGFAQTLKDFGFKKGSGTLQGSNEADLLDLRQLLDGYTSTSTASDFLRLAKTTDNKLILNIDHDGGTSFSTTATLLFDNVTVDSSNQLLAGGQFVATNNGNLTLDDALKHLITEQQLRVL